MKALMVLGLLATSAWGGSITIAVDYDSRYGAVDTTFNMDLNGVTAHRYSSGSSTIGHLPFCDDHPVCTFTPALGTISIAGGGYPTQVVYHGDPNGPMGIGYLLTLTLVAIGDGATVPLTGTPPFTYASWTAVPFTVTGSYTVKLAGDVIQSGNLTGEGTANASASGLSSGLIFSSSAFYSLSVEDPPLVADAPEPAALVLAASGLAAIAYRRSKCDTIGA